MQVQQCHQGYICNVVGAVATCNSRRKEDERRTRGGKPFVMPLLCMLHFPYDTSPLRACRRGRTRHPSACFHVAIPLDHECKCNNVARVIHYTFATSLVPSQRATQQAKGEGCVYYVGGKPSCLFVVFSCERVACHRNPRHATPQPTSTLQSRVRTLVARPPGQRKMQNRALFHVMENANITNWYLYDDKCLQR
jgi:hypothetical protein